MSKLSLIRYLVLHALALISLSVGLDIPLKALPGSNPRCFCAFADFCSPVTEFRSCGGCDTSTSTYKLSLESIISLSLSLSVYLSIYLFFSQKEKVPSWWSSWWKERLSYSFSRSPPSCSVLSATYLCLVFSHCYLPPPHLSFKLGTHRFALFTTQSTSGFAYSTIWRQVLRWWSYPRWHLYSSQISALFFIPHTKSRASPRLFRTTAGRFSIFWFSQSSHLGPSFWFHERWKCCFGNIRRRFILLIITKVCTTSLTLSLSLSLSL